MKIELKVPQIVSQTAKTLQNKGFSAYLVGGCVRDLLIGRRPKDWDITTNAKPEEIVEAFPKTFYENSFGTVTVVNENTDDETLKNIEITPYRTETGYSDKRHPDKVEFGDNLEKDLERRDFTINAVAYDPTSGSIIDPFGGIKDIKDKVIRAVGKPEDRFNEDALRILRAIRLATELGFMLNISTEKSLEKQAEGLLNVSQERVRDEFNKIISSSSPMAGLILAQKTAILGYILPELEETLHVKQNGDHIYDVWEHSLRALQHAANQNWMLHVRLAALFHDIAKPKTRRWDQDKKDWTFYGHDVVGLKITKKIMSRLKYPNDLTETVVKLVASHMFFTDIDKITLSAVRRIIAKVGQENVWDLMKLRACDRIGMGRPKENPYRLRKYESMIEEAMRAPTSVGMLKIDGKTIMEVSGETPGPRIGFILHGLLEEVLENPELNTEGHLTEKALELAKKDDETLKKLGESGKNKKEEVEEGELKKIRSRHGVK